jgi:hypothetical protein
MVGGFIPRGDVPGRYLRGAPPRHV